MRAGGGPGLGARPLWGSGSVLLVGVPAGPGGGGPGRCLWMSSRRRGPGVGAGAVLTGCAEGGEGRRYRAHAGGDARSARIGSTAVSGAGTVSCPGRVVPRD